MGKLWPSLSFSLCRLNKEKFSNKNETLKKWKLGQKFVHGQVMSSEWFGGHSKTTFMPVLDKGIGW